MFLHVLSLKNQLHSQQGVLKINYVSELSSIKYWPKEVFSQNIKICHHQVSQDCSLQTLD